MPFIPNILFYNVFRFFNRRELFLLSLIYRRFRGIVDSGFSTAPLAILDSRVCYKALDVWAVYPQGGGIELVSQDFIAHLSDMKFIRFKTCYVLDICSSNQAENVLKTVKHIWEGQRLVINYKDCTPNIKFLHEMTTASILSLKCAFDDSMSAAVKELLKGSCKKIVLEQKGGGSSNFQLPVAEVANFLLHDVYESPHCSDRFFFLKTVMDPQMEDREALFDAVEKVQVTRYF